jgi:hypothetical protein
MDATLRQYIIRSPKTELHLHIEGTLAVARKCKFCETDYRRVVCALQAYGLRVNRVYRHIKVNAVAQKHQHIG